jgi:uncharacterized membrane protein YhiD involved in acid resistance
MFQLRMKDLVDFNSLSTVGNYTFAQILANILVALLCGLIIYFVYKKTFTGVLYSRNFGVTVAIITVVTSLIVMAIHGNLALSLGMIGALSIVRFRTPVKDPKDLAYLFWAIATGVICGISAYKLAFVSVLFVGLMLFFLSKRIGLSTPYLVVLKMATFEREKLEEVFKSGCTKFKERSLTVLHDKVEVVYEVMLRKVTSSDLLNQIRTIPGIDETVVLSYDGELDEAR